MQKSVTNMLGLGQVARSSVVNPPTRVPSWLCPIHRGIAMSGSRSFAGPLVG